MHRLKARDQHNPTERRQAPPARKSWLTGFGAALVALLIIGTSIIFFVLRGITTSTGSPASMATPPPAGQWINLDNRYLFSSLEAVPTNPALVYACASPYPQGNAPHYTLLRSNDFGAHWQDLGKQAALRDFCQLTINPANSNELYVVTAGTPTGGTTPDVLKHSSDGGQTWNTLQPKMQMDQQTTIAWHIQQLQQIGRDLFGIQWTSPLAYGTAQPAPTTPSRLVRSSDGGKTWTFINNNLAPTTLAIHNYAVDPTDTRIIYEIAGPPPHLNKPGITTSASTSLMTLYKTTDGGTHWQQLLTDILPDSSLQLASAQPTTLYISETTGNRPFSTKSAAASTVTPRSPVPISFRMRTSTDGGANWHSALQVVGKNGSADVHGWFSTATGQLYTLIGTTSSSPTQIRRYDPTSNQWSDVTKLPQPGSELLAVTSTGTNNGAVLWLRSLAGGKTTLYRYVA